MNNLMANHERLLRIDGVLERIPVSKSQWWNWVSTGKAPAGIKLSSRVTTWRESEINAFISEMAGETEVQNATL